MDTDDLEPARPSLSEPRDLDMMSVAALEGYIGELEAEIDRVRAKIDAKKSARGAADSVFKF